MSKLILFTDIHITQSGKTIIGIDPIERFEQGLAHALDHHPDAKGIIISGDLVHRGSLQEYERLKASLANCKKESWNKATEHTNTKKHF